MGVERGAPDTTTPQQRQSGHPGGYQPVLCSVKIFPITSVRLWFCPQQLLHVYLFDGFRTSMWLTYGFCSFCFKRVVSIKIFLLVFYIMFLLYSNPPCLNGEAFYMFRLISTTYYYFKRLDWLICKLETQRYYVLCFP